MAVKLQEMFGTTATPVVGDVGGGRAPVPVTIDLLAPNGRVSARTSDLVTFFKEGYGSVRAELRARYSKHPWPEDPMTAEPTRSTNKQLRAAAAADAEPARAR